MSNLYLVWILITLIIVGGSLSFISIYLFNKKSENLTDSNNHIAMSGVALGYLLLSVFNFNDYYVNVLMIFYVLVFINIGLWIQKKYKINFATMIQIQTSVAGAILATIYSFKIRIGVDLHNFLFGNVLLINNENIVIIISICVLTLIYFILMRHKLNLITISEVEARTQGIKTSLIDHLTLSVISIITVIIVKFIGSFLISATLSIPLLSALQFSKSKKQLHHNVFILISISFCFGILTANYINISVSALIVFIQILIFIITTILLKIKLLKSNK